MATQYTPILQLALPVTGELNGTWGDVVNDNITSMVEQAIAGMATISTWTANAHTLTTANGTTDEARCAMLLLQTGSGGTALSGAGQVICPALTKLYVVKNDAAYAVTVKTSGGSGVSVSAGDTTFVFCDGTNVVACVTQITNGHITGNLTVDGNTTLGDASGDTLTINGTAVSVPNSLNFDGNTLFIDSTNNRVGINTASPSYSLDAQGGTSRFGSGTSATVIGNLSTLPSNDVQAYMGWAASTFTGASNGYMAYVPRTTTGSPGGHIFYSGDTTPVERMRITTTGTVGIGTNNPGTYSANLAVAVDGSSGPRVVAVNTNATSNNADFRLVGPSGIVGLFAADSNGNGGVDVSVGANNASGYLRLLAGGGEKVRLTSTGYVGINTTSPSTYLSVYGNASRYSELMGDLMRQRLAASEGGWQMGYTFNANDTTALGGLYAGGTSQSIGSLQLILSSQTRFFISASGIGINTNSPAVTLEVTDSSASYIKNTANTTYQAVNLNVNSGGTVYCGIDNSSGSYLTGTAYSGFLWNSAAAPLVFGANNSEKMRIDSSGNVGIGTTNPGNYKLNVNGVASSFCSFLSYTADGLFNANALPGVIRTPGMQQILFGYTDAGGGQYAPRIGFLQASPSTPAKNSIGNEIDGSFTFCVGSSNTERMRIDSSGNVGIGTSSPSSYGKLAIGYASAASTTTNVLSVYQSAGVDAATARFATYNYNGLATAIDFIQNSASNFQSQMAFYTNSGGGIAERMRIDSSGNVGIGTSGPHEKIEIAGNSSTVSQNILINNRGDGGYPGTTPYNVGGIYGAAYRDIANPAYIAGIAFYRDSAVTGLASAGSILFYTAQFGEGSASALQSYERMRIDSSGNVGIGTSSPAAKLDVIGTTKVTGLFYVQAPTNTATFQLYGASAATDGAWAIKTQATRSLTFTDDYAGSERMRINSSGSLLIADTSNPLGGKLYVNGGSSMRGFYMALTPSGGLSNNFGELNYTGQFSMTSGQTITLWQNNGYYATQFFEVFVQNDYGPRTTNWWRGQCSGYGGAVTLLEANNGSAGSFSFTAGSPSTGNCAVSFTNIAASSTIRVWVRIFGTGQATDAVVSSYIAPNL